ncbi:MULTISPECIES: GtrA family protein [Actinomyces]|uniref:GtrA family protein n=1 Tax=Actinomyces TaxID=1654 RepID=UPI001FAA84B9|nr:MULTISPECIES: GtrA family protein [Actinomyces]
MPGIRQAWSRFEERHETLAQFIVFFVVSNGITVLQLVLMPVFRWVFRFTSLEGTPFHFLPVGSSGGQTVYLFDYAAGAIQADGSGGGLAYFLAVEITLLIAQVINFFAQRSITFRSNSSVWKAALWYTIAYIIITVFAAAAQVVYKGPIYSWCQSVLGASSGEAVADVITMVINAAISFWVFFPIFKVIFRREPEPDGGDLGTGQATGEEADKETGKGVGQGSAHHTGQAAGQDSVQEMAKP